MRRLLVALSSLAALVVMGGCATGEKVRITASTPKPGRGEQQSYVLRSRDSAFDPGSLHHREAVGHIKTALSARGMYEAPPGAKADLVIEVAYQVGPPIHREVPRATPRIVEPDTTMRIRRARSLPVRAKSGEQTAPTGLDAKEIITVYEKSLVIEGRANETPVDPVPLWRLVVTSTGEDNSLRRNLPILAAASIDHLASDSKGEKRVRIDGEHPDVGFVRKGL